MLDASSRTIVVFIVLASCCMIGAAGEVTIVQPFEEQVLCQDLILANC